MVANPIHQGADLRALDAFEFTENTVNGWTEKQTYFHVNSSLTGSETLPSKPIS